MIFVERILRRRAARLPGTEAADMAEQRREEVDILGEDAGLAGRHTRARAGGHGARRGSRSGESSPPCREDVRGRQLYPARLSTAAGAWVGQRLGMRGGQLGNREKVRQFSLLRLSLLRFVDS